jgi:molecular chaperone GrpE
VSGKKTDPNEDLQAAEGTEGWESLSEEAEAGSLAPNPELEDAMREAMEAVEAREEERRQPARGGEAAELHDRLLRLQADFENFRKRTLKEKEEAFRYGHQNIVKDLLPTVDNLERAIEHARGSQTGDLEGLLQGVELVLRELLGILEQHGLVVIEAEGQTFDPAVHEAMTQQIDESVPANTVMQVFQKGYRLRDRLLRPARVMVSGGPSEGSGEEKSEDG